MVTASSDEKYDAVEPSTFEKIPSMLLLCSVLGGAREREVAALDLVGAAAAGQEVVSRCRR